MSERLFADMELTDEIRMALDSMGFETATEIQWESIPLIKSGADVIGRSQTGTGKTIAFGIPAIDAVDRSLDLKNSPQILMLCPTRELAVQAEQEVKKLAAHKPGIRTVCVYGGAPMERQIMQLKRANIVVGTPGRVMDHMRRRTLKLDQLKMIVLDEADEMLSMGFREDIETILKDTPEERQTILFSATMPPAILALTKMYQKDPKLVQVAKQKVTVDSIEQCYYEVPMGRKMDALNLILKYYNPAKAMIFCNTKRMVEEVSEYLSNYDFSAEGLHGDMKQAQRNRVMDAFKQGRLSVLIATDVAARGIDVNDIEYVINYDIPQNPEYYVHRIGRTGRAGKSGKAVTICSGRRQVSELLMLGRSARSEIARKDVPTGKKIDEVRRGANALKVEEAIAAMTDKDTAYTEMVETLNGRGHTSDIIAAALLKLHFAGKKQQIRDVPACNYPKDTRTATVGTINSGRGHTGGFRKLNINIGRMDKVAPNHIVGAITASTSLCGGQIGKIEIYDNNTVVSVPENSFEQTLSDMEGLKILRKATVTTPMTDLKSGQTAQKPGGGRPGFANSKDYRNLRSGKAPARNVRRPARSADGKPAGNK